jgi:hypothetical protein
LFTAQASTFTCFTGIKFNSNNITGRGKNCGILPKEVVIFNGKICIKLWMKNKNCVYLPNMQNLGTFTKEKKEFGA